MDTIFDFDQISEDVKKVISYSQGFDLESMNISPFMKQWLEAKKEWIRRLNGNLMYELPEPVSFELNEDSKRQNIENFAEDIDDHYSNYPLSKFISHLSTDEFYNNRTSREHIIGNFTVPANLKVVKAFKFFEDNEEPLKEMQSAASRIIQENVITGRLVLSVHPLDFLSSSENVHNWRSCHALDGEYRSGNLSYMMDPNTVICYLRAEKSAVLPRFPEDVLWNSKKWRVLLFFSNDNTMLFAGRQYPFTADVGINKIKDEILPAIGMGKWSCFYRDGITKYRDSYSDTLFSLPFLIPIGQQAVRKTDLIKDGANTLHYNDLLRSSCYVPVWSYQRHPNFWRDPPTGLTSADTRFEIGRKCICPICGKGLVAYTELMTCTDCGEKYNSDDLEYTVCDCCGSSVYIEDVQHLPFSDENVCPTCFERETVECIRCGIRDYPDAIKYRPGSTHCLCPDCYEKTRKEENYGEGYNSEGEC